MFLLVRYLLPMMLLAAVAEGFGLVEWGRPQTGLHRIHKFPVGEAVVYESLRLLLLLLVVVICAALIKMFGETFRERHTYRQTFTLVIFGLSPLFLLRLLDAAPGINPCISWAIGIVLMPGGGLSGHSARHGARPAQCHRVVFHEFIGAGGNHRPGTVHHLLVFERTYAAA